MRILLFLATNAAILAVLSITMRLFGVEGALDANGVDLNINGLLIISAVVGFTGSFISLARLFLWPFQNGWRNAQQAQKSSKLLAMTPSAG